ncbi:MAG: bifunctional phosphoribosylaminoimidazolecarboxamide formyltransferase/IMP cyclohydrolase [Acidaminococcales bacterium]|jgi:phosphoribosylaminoimidazolecarboxamide formyltransferase/IMP cyclohydrolase|nr:bifunctional phosphoribosylaminoimidazolecarboxamide formyltransferase/IMP cyclohydrolase [Acidaminococcales bacterium]
MSTKIKRALISVSDKEGIAGFARFLHEMGVEIISTGGTMKALKDAGLPVTYVGDLTGFPEIMDGRVKTLNPLVHGGILAVRDNPRHAKEMQEQGIKPIDLVAVNLYPFCATIAKPGVTDDMAIENIDIGGPAMIRAAAKNHKYVAVAVNPSAYGKIMDALKLSGEISDSLRRELAEEAFRHTSEYDAAVAGWLSRQIAPEAKYPQEAVIHLEKVQELRYGENPHQTAAFYREKGAREGVAAARQLGGKELSFNNIIDIEAAYRIVADFERPAAAIVKHTNPCGVGLGGDLCAAYQKALSCDPVSAFGGIIGLNRMADRSTAEEISGLFAEAVIAPGYEPDALQILKAKKNLRILELPPLARSGKRDMKKVSGGMLMQSLDEEFALKERMKTVTKRPPSEAEWEQLLFALKVAKHVKSNAIVLAKEFRTVGVGAGQMNRVGAAEIAVKQAGGLAKGAVLASDAFFPFGDTVKVAAAAGVTAIIQPGGSIRDEESIAAADGHNIAMVFSGLRHFKH